jgi:hypothetical protein
MRMKSRLTALAITVLATATVASAATAAPISKAVLFQTKSLNVGCGVEIHAPGKPATEVLCSAKGIPAPKGKGVGDAGFVEIGVLGKPKLIRTSQDSFVGTKPVTLGRGRLWNQIGVTCHVGLVKVLCFNGDNQGFVIGNGHYQAF